ncbi:MAG: hypothetical protein AAFQ98_14290 [Bacteroidota bacterium]
MTELEEIWAEQPQETIDEDTVNKYLQEKSAGELRFFEHLIRIELGVGSILLLSSLWWLGSSPDIVKGFMMVVIWISVMLAGITLWRIKKITFQSDVRAYLEKSLRFFQAYLASFSVTALALLIASIIVFKQNAAPDISWGTWLATELGLKLPLVMAGIILMMAVYAYFLYYPRIKRLKDLLAALDAEE